MPSSIDARLAELGITLPEVAGPGRELRPLRRHRRAGLRLGPGQPRRGRRVHPGKLGDGIDAAAGAAAARTCGLALIAVLKTACGGDLGRVKRVVKLTGFVNSAPDFTDQPKVINGAPT